MLSAATEAWVLSATGADAVVDVAPLAGGISSTIRALRLAGGTPRECVLREMTHEPWRSSAAELLDREAGVQRELEASAVPVPRLIAVDAGARRAGEPSLLMTRLPGRPDLTGPDLDALAAMLLRIHRHDPPRRPREFQLWTDPSRWVVPEWAVRRETFERAFARIADPPAAGESCFLHRDFQPGNVLFDGGRVSGVVDWVETSWGPPDLDVAHCATNLALLCGGAVAERWPHAYRRAGGRLSADFAYWALVDAVSMLSEPAKLVPAWRAAGRDDLSDALLHRRLEAHLAAQL